LKSKLIFLFLFLISAACTKTDADSTTAANALAAAFPSGLAVSSPTAQASTSLLSIPNDVSVLAVDSTDPASEKKTTLDALINGTTCSVAITLQSATNANCYGPSVTYVNHPNSSANAPGGDLGIWTASQNSEACAAAQLNSRMNGVASLVDMGMFATAGLICKANSAGQSLPAIGQSLDLTASMAGLITVNTTAITLTAATLSREANNSDGNPVYISTISGTAGTKTYSIRMKHTPNTTDNSTYQGKLSVSVGDNDGTKPGNCNGIGGAATGQTDATSISYSKSATAVVYELKSANFCGNNVDPYVSASNKSVDLTAKVSGGNVDGWGNNGNYLLASYDPTTFVGTFKYAWQAGMNDAKTRAFNAQITATGGVAYFGFGAAIESASGVGDITGIHCNWLNGLAAGTLTTKAQKQIMTLTAGKFAATSSFITYDPVDSCESTDATFTITPTGGSATAANTTTMDLINITDISSNISTITAPTNVDL